MQCCSMLCSYMPVKILHCPIRACTFRCEISCRCSRCWCTLDLHFCDLVSCAAQFHKIKLLAAHQLCTSACLPAPGDSRWCCLVLKHMWQMLHSASADIKRICGRCCIVHQLWGIEVPWRADCHATMQERRWFFIRNGNGADYHGPAVHWRHLSRWERHICKYHLQYDPVADLQQRRDAKLAGNAYNPSQPLMNGKAPHPQNGTAV